MLGWPDKMEHTSFFQRYCWTLCNSEKKIIFCIKMCIYIISSGKQTWGKSSSWSPSSQVVLLMTLTLVSQFATFLSHRDTLCWWWHGTDASRTTCSCEPGTASINILLLRSGQRMVSNFFRNPPQESIKDKYIHHAQLGQPTPAQRDILPPQMWLLTLASDKLWAQMFTWGTMFWLG